MKFKKTAVIALTTLICFSQNSAAYAQANTVRQDIVKDSIITPYWTNLDSVEFALYYENGLANCYATIQGFSGTTNINATLTLQRYTSTGWVSDKFWIRSTNGDYIEFFNTYAEPTGSTYRLLLTTKITRNGSTENITTTSSEVKF